MPRLSVAKNTILILSVVAIVGAIYFVSNPKPQYYYDYTFRVADNLLRGAIGFQERPPTWLNEFVPYEGNWYSVFPFGAVVSMIPFSALKVAGLVETMPAAMIASILGAAVFGLFCLIAREYELELSKLLLVTFGIVFGSWMWTNLTMAGAWHLALGWSMVGQLGAIYFTVFRRRPLAAGFFFAIAFGNRTEILLTAPIFMYLLCRDSSEPGENPSVPVIENGSKIAGLALFCAVPFMLGVSTLIYNQIRFDSFIDFGYARIPGVLDEPWYRYGIFSLHYIPQNAWEMLATPWRQVASYPYFVPTGFGGAIWWSSPFLLFLLRRGSRDRTLKNCAWLALAVLTFVLWIHGNPGGWQFGYRYAMILLPWMFVILLENGSRKSTLPEIALYGFSILVNAYATYLFFWTDHVKP